MELTSATFLIVDKLERFGHLVIEALAKARELQRFVLSQESKARVVALMERVKKSRQTAEGLARFSAANGKGLDRATLNRTLDRLIATMDRVNRELDALLAKAKGE
jgi:hypothetical protein